MNPGQQVVIMVIDNGVVCQHPPLSPLEGVVPTPEQQPKQQQNTAVALKSFNELETYLKGLELFQDEA